MTRTQVEYKAEPDGVVTVLAPEAKIQAGDFFEWVPGNYTRVEHGSHMVGLVCEKRVVLRILENTLHATTVAQAVANVHRFAKMNAPAEIQTHAMKCLTRKVAPHAKPGNARILAEFLLNVCAAHHIIRTGTDTPPTAEVLEDIFKRNPNGGH